MAHFAELDANDVVLRVIVVANADCTNAAGVEDEATGIAFCQRLFGAETRWAQTSYNGNIRVRYAGEGYTLDRTLDAFLTPKPYPSWVLDEASYDWVAPVPYPTDGGLYVWDEDSLSWVSSQTSVSS